MKKLLLSFLILLFITTGSYAFELIPKLSICLPGTFRSDYEVDVCANFGAEARFHVSDYIALSTGFDYLFNRNVSLGKKAEEAGFGGDMPYNNKRFSMLPVFVGIIVYPFGNFGEYKPYLIVNGGYNILFTIEDGNDSTPGIYCAGGIGFELYEKYILEVYMSRYEAKDNDNDITYKNIYFKLGYKFTI